MLTAPLLACCLLAQVLPSGPIEMAGGTVSVGGEVSITAGSRDDIAFFNFTDYEHNALRLFRVSLSGMWRPSARLAVVTEVRSEDLKRVMPYALYVRARPWKDRKIDIQAGRIPPVFGAFARRSYGAADNPLIGYPLAYQYLISLRPDAIPASADDLLFMRARGWRANFPVGNLDAAPGVPIISAYRWETGVEGHVEAGVFDISAAVTSGTLADPDFRNHGHRPQLSGRVAAKPITGLVVGASASTGPFVNDSLAQAYATSSGGHSFTQDALGVDAEYSRGYWIVRGEAIHSRWTLPLIGTPTIGGPITADSGFVESRYRFTPRFFVAGRVDRLTFSTVQGVRFFPGVETPWDSPVTRVEAGGGMYLQRNVTIRATVQGNWRDAGRVLHRAYVSGQLSYWF